MAPKRYWLMKCEPGAYSIDDLERDGESSWEGVRNFQARNLLRDEVEVGDGVLFYASNAEPSGVTGIAEVARAGYPDPFAFKRGHKYYDPESDPQHPTWYAVDIRFVEKFPEIVPLATLKATPGLAAMRVVQKGSRLSVQPVTAGEFETVRRLGTAGPAAAGAAADAAAGKAKANSGARSGAKAGAKATAGGKARTQGRAKGRAKGNKGDLGKATKQGKGA
ncbi:MAG TPA: EVE domain-containing protein [Gemmataceae bacterium]|jgi:predicted RNA-binding protein with PUA-like domain|nr:EVE domain-containing protein [Gemmataceae bacterium]